MKIKLKDIDITAKIPEINSVMATFEAKGPSIEERKKTIDLFREVLDLGKMFPVDIQDSLHFVSEKGEIQFYKPSGALWINNSILDDKYSDERRDWKVVKTKDREDPTNTSLILVESEQKNLVEQATELFEKANILSKEAYFSEVELDQVAQLDNKGNEIDRFAGEANVKFLYKLDDIQVDGPGAKSYAFYNPGKVKHELNGIFHAWREITGARKISIPSVEESLERAIAQDGELILYKERQHSIKLTNINIVYFSLPPFKYQNYIFPVFRVIGSVIPKDKGDKHEGFEFSRYYNVAPPESYAKADIYAGYLATCL